MSFYLGGKSRGAFGQTVQQNDCSDCVEGLNLRKNTSINVKKMFKRILSCLFGGRRKVQVSTSYLLSVLVRTVGTTLEFAAFCSRPDAKYSTASAFWFFLSTAMVFAAVRKHFPRKNTSTFMSIGILSQKKQ